MLRQLAKSLQTFPDRPREFRQRSCLAKVPAVHSRSRRSCFNLPLVEKFIWRFDIRLTKRIKTNLSLHAKTLPVMTIDKSKQSLQVKETQVFTKLNLRNLWCRCQTPLGLSKTISYKCFFFHSSTQFNFSLEKNCLLETINANYDKLKIYNGTVSDREGQPLRRAGSVRRIRALFTRVLQLSTQVFPAAVHFTLSPR